MFTILCIERELIQNEHLLACNSYYNFHVKDGRIRYVKMIFLSVFPPQIHWGKLREEQNFVPEIGEISTKAQVHHCTVSSSLDSKAGG